MYLGHSLYLYVENPQSRSMDVNYMLKVHFGIRNTSWTYMFVGQIIQISTGIGLKVNLSLSFPRGRMGYWYIAPLILKLSTRRKWSNSCPGHFTPWKETRYLLKVIKVRLRTSLDFLEKRKTPHRPVPSISLYRLRIPDSTIQRMFRVRCAKLQDVIL
jgi:hypothetical protein